MKSFLVSIEKPRLLKNNDHRRVWDWDSALDIIFLLFSRDCVTRLELSKTGTDG